MAGKPMNKATAHLIEYGVYTLYVSNLPVGQYSPSPAQRLPLVVPSQSHGPLSSAPLSSHHTLCEISPAECEVTHYAATTLYSATGLVQNRVLYIGQLSIGMM